ncbi:recombinase, partial [Sphingobium sp. AN641]
MRSNERAINQLLDRIIEADNPTIIKAYENRLRLLEQNKAMCAEKAANLGRPKGDFEKTVRSALVFLASPWEIYKNGSLEVRRMVLKLTFAERPSYSPKDGVRSALTTSPFRILSDLKGGMEAMV